MEHLILLIEALVATLVNELIKHLILPFFFPENPVPFTNYNLQIKSNQISFYISQK